MNDPLLSGMGMGEAGLGCGMGMEWERSASPGWDALRSKKNHRVAWQLDKQRSSVFSVFLIGKFLFQEIVSLANSKKNQQTCVLMISESAGWVVLLVCSWLGGISNL